MVTMKVSLKFIFNYFQIGDNQGFTSQLQLDCSVIIKLSMYISTIKRPLDPLKLPQKLTHSKQFQQFIQIRNGLQTELAKRSCLANASMLKSLIQKISPYLEIAQHTLLKSNTKNFCSNAIIKLLFSRIQRERDPELLALLVELLISQHKKNKLGGGKIWKKSLDIFSHLLRHQHNQVGAIGLQGVRFIVYDLVNVVLTKHLQLRDVDHLLLSSDRPVVLGTLKLLIFDARFVELTAQHETCRLCFVTLLRLMRDYKINDNVSYIQTLKGMNSFSYQKSYSQIQKVIDSGILGFISQMVLSQNLTQSEGFVFNIILTLTGNGLPSQKKAICRSAFVDKLMLFGLHSLNSKIRLVSCQILINMTISPSSIDMMFSNKMVSRLLSLFRSDVKEVVDTVKKLLVCILKNGLPAHFKDFIPILGSEIIRQVYHQSLNNPRYQQPNVSFTLMIQVCRAGRCLPTNEPVIMLRWIAARMPAGLKAKFIWTVQQYDRQFLSEFKIFPLPLIQ